MNFIEIPVDGEGICIPYFGQASSDFPDPQATSAGWRSLLISLPLCCGPVCKVGGSMFAAGMSYDL